MARTIVSPTNQGPRISAPLRGRSTSFFWSQATLASPALRPALRSSFPSRPPPVPSPSSTDGDSLGSSGALGSLLGPATGFFGSSPLSLTTYQAPAPTSRTTATA